MIERVVQVAAAVLFAFEVPLVSFFLRLSSSPCIFERSVYTLCMLAHIFYEYFDIDGK